MELPTLEALISAPKALIAGIFGAALSIAYAKPATAAQSLIGFVTGCAVAYYGTPVVMHLGKSYIPAELSSCISFFVGFVSYRAVPAALALVDRLRDIKLPFLG